jgi:toxin ParE1/3/4
MKRASVRWSARAEADLMAIGEHIARDKPSAARAWVEKLRRCANEAALAPMAHRRVPEAEHDDIREALRRGYRIVFKVRSRGIDVLTVFEGHKTLVVDDE